MSTASAAAAAAIDPPFIYSGPPPFVIFSGVEAAAAFPPPLPSRLASAATLIQAIVDASLVAGPATCTAGNEDITRQFNTLVQHAVSTGNVLREIRPLVDQGMTASFATTPLPSGMITATAFDALVQRAVAVLRPHLHLVLIDAMTASPIAAGTYIDTPSSDPSPLVSSSIAFAELVQQAVVVVHTELPPALAAYEVQVQERVAVAAAWNNRSRAVAVLGSSGLGWGVNVLPYLRPSVEGRAMHATSQEIRVAVRRTHWVDIEV
jgi:hypothetical protein